MEPISAQRMVTIFNQIPLGLVLLDEQGSVYFVNDSMVKIAGYDADDLLDLGFYNKLFPTADVNLRIREKSLSALSASFDDLDLTLVNQNQEKVAAHISGACVKESDATSIVLVIQDVTNKKAFEKVIESSFDNFIQVTNALDAAMKKINEQNAILEEYKLKMTRELNIAKSVQKAIIPKVFPRIANFDMFGVSLPSEELGGDYFDYFLLDNNLLGILIADVSGHGVPSSLITTMVKAYFEYYTKRFWEPDKVLQNVNRDMAGIIMDTGFYLTAFYAVLDCQTWKMTVSVAGHDAALGVTKGKSTMRLGEGCEGTILGVFPDAVYTSVSYQLEPETKVIVYTDGITEARSDTGEFYGPQRLLDFLATQLGKSSRESVDELIKEIDAFYGTSHPNDDRTLVIFDILGGERPDFESKDAFRRGKKAFLDKEFKQALAEFESLVQQGTENTELFYLAGQSCCFTGDYSKAVKYLEKSVELDPSAFKSYYYLGIVYHNQKDFESARRSWERVLQIQSDYKDTRELLDKLDKKP